MNRSLISLNERWITMTIPTKAAVNITICFGVNSGSAFVSMIERNFDLRKVSRNFSQLGLNGYNTLI